jgi:hypothetical protein
MVTLEDAQMALRRGATEPGRTVDRIAARKRI